MVIVMGNVLKANSQEKVCQWCEQINGTGHQLSGSFFQILLLITALDIHLGFGINALLQYHCSPLARALQFQSVPIREIRGRTILICSFLIGAPLPHSRKCPQAGKFIAKRPTSF